MKLTLNYPTLFSPTDERNLVLKSFSLEKHRSAVADVGGKVQIPL